MLVWLVAVLAFAAAVPVVAIGAQSGGPAQAGAAPLAKPSRTPKPTPSPTPAPTPSPCATSGPGGYTVTVCITAPAAGATLNGARPVTLTADQSAGGPGIQRLLFSVDGVQALTDFNSPYTFTLDTTRWADGVHTLRASAAMRDAFTSSPATIQATFSNGQSQPRQNPNHFTPVTAPTPPGDTPLVIGAVGDGADGGAGAAATVGLIASWNPSLFLYLGDVYEDGLPLEFDNWYGGTGVAGTYGQLRPITNPTIGNHEYTGLDASGYFFYWDNVAHFYSFNAGGWHFIALDSTSQFNQYDPTSAQYQWLASDLAANSSPCTIVYYHHPILNVGPEGQTTRMGDMWKLFDQYHVTLVLNGHDHDYQRFTPIDGNLNPSLTGITEFVVGSGGHGHQSQVTTDSRLVSSDFTSFGALRLNLYRTSAAFEFRTTTGATNDSGLIPCRGTNDASAPSAPGAFAAQANGTSEIDLSWTASTDDVGIAGYEVFRDGSSTPLATLAPDARTYVDGNLAPSTTHAYTMKAFDAAGHRSPAAGPASATTDAGTSTIVLTPTADSYVTSGSPTTNFGSSTVLRAGSGSTTYNSYLKFDLSSLPGAVQSATLSILSNTTTSIPISARGSSSSWTEGGITYSNAPALGAIVSSSGGLTNGSRATLDVTPLVAPAQGGSVTIAITRTGSQVSLASRESGSAPQLTVVTGAGSGSPPTASFTASATSTVVGNSITFTDTSTGSPTSWSWDFGDGTASTSQNPSHSWTAAGPYTVRLVASNAYGASAPATASITVSADTTPPSTPGSLTATANGTSEIDLSWTAATDDVGVTAYEIRRDNGSTPIATVGPGVLTYADKPLAPGSSHSYTVTALDAAGNPSDPAGPASATTASGTTTITLRPVADAYVYELNPDTNFGANTSIRVKGSTPQMRSYLRFDLSAVVGTVQSATLTLTPSANTSAGVSIWRVADTSWGESAITWNNAPALDATSSGTIPGPLTSGVAASGSMTSLASGAAGGLLSIALTTTGSQEPFGSRESATPPTLTIVVGS